MNTIKVRVALKKSSILEITACQQLGIIEERNVSERGHNEELGEGLLELAFQCCCGIHWKACPGLLIARQTPRR